VDAGIIAYSPVNHPLPVPFKKAGTLSSNVAVQITLVLPNSIKADPLAYEIKLGIILTGLSSLYPRLSGRIFYSPLFYQLENQAAIIQQPD
jgi:hypothetical protein